MDLGEKGQRPDRSGGHHGQDGALRSQGAISGEEGHGPEECQERIERSQMGVGEDAGHRPQREPGGDAGGKSPAAAPRPP